MPSRSFRKTGMHQVILRWLNPSQTLFVISERLQDQNTPHTPQSMTGTTAPLGPEISSTRLRIKRNPKASCTAADFLRLMIIIERTSFSQILRNTTSVLSTSLALACFASPRSSPSRVPQTKRIADCSLVGLNARKHAKHHVQLTPVFFPAATVNCLADVLGEI